MINKAPCEHVKTIRMVILIQQENYVRNNMLLKWYQDLELTIIKGGG